MYLQTYQFRFWAFLLLLSSGNALGCQSRLNSSENLIQCQKEAEAGNAAAQRTLALFYQKGEGVERNNEQALRWYLKAAEQGLVVAQYELAVLYHAGEVVERDYPQAIRWYRRAAEADNIQAQHSLGLIYEQGLIVAQSYPEALHWYSLAAEKGVSGDQFALGQIYQQGHEGVAPNRALAEQWYLKAARQKHREALYQLALLHWEDVEERGAHHRILGYLYFTLAAQLNHPEGVRKRDQLRSELSAQQLAEVEQRLASWSWSY